MELESARTTAPTPTEVGGFVPQAVFALGGCHQEDSCRTRRTAGCCTPARPPAGRGEDSAWTVLGELGVFLFGPVVAGEGVDEIRDRTIGPVKAAAAETERAGSSVLGDIP